MLSATFRFFCVRPSPSLTPVLSHSLWYLEILSFLITTRDIKSKQKNKYNKMVNHNGIILEYGWSPKEARLINVTMACVSDKG